MTSPIAPDLYDFIREPVIRLAVYRLADLELDPAALCRLEHHIGRRQGKRSRAGAYDVYPRLGEEGGNGMVGCDGCVDVGNYEVFLVE